MLIYSGVIFVVFPRLYASKVSSSTRLVLPGPGSGEMAVKPPEMAVPCDSKITWLDNAGTRF